MSWEDCSTNGRAGGSVRNAIFPADGSGCNTMFPADGSDCNTMFLAAGRVHNAMFLADGIRNVGYRSVSMPAVTCILQVWKGKPAMWQMNGTVQGNASAPKYPIACFLPEKMRFHGAVS